MHQLTRYNVQFQSTKSCFFLYSIVYLQQNLSKMSPSWNNNICRSTPIYFSRLVNYRLKCSSRTTPLYNRHIFLDAPEWLHCMPQGFISVFHKALAIPVFIVHDIFLPISLSRFLTLIDAHVSNLRLNMEHFIAHFAR